MYPIPPSETLIESKNCKHCSASFPITDKDMEFYDKVSPTFWGKKYQIPTPTLCPDCRQQRRESWHNETRVYKNICSITGEDIFSMYRPWTTHTVVSSKYWWSDNWEGIDFGRDWDPQISTMAQLWELLRVIPRAGNLLALCENCDYCDNLRGAKDCYYTFNWGSGSTYFENGYYTVTTGEWCRNVVDTFWTTQSENWYELTHINNSYGSSYSYSCDNITNCHYVQFCYGCADCTLCAGLTNQKFSFRNIAYTESEYKEKVSSFMLLPARKRTELANEFFRGMIKKHHHNNQSHNISGDYLMYCSNTYNSFFWWAILDGKYLYTSFQVSDCMDCYNLGVTGTLCYETFNSNRSHNILFSTSCTEQSTNLLYCDTCVTCTNCTLCVGLRNKSYCILNKQYTKEEYEELVPHIIEKMMVDGEWGEFFPSTMSPFGYNETVAQEYFPLLKSEAVWNGRWNWSDYEAPFPTVEKVIPASLLPEHITQIPDDVLNWAIECEVSGKPFRIIRQELEFYRKHSLPIPRRHPDQRHLDRMALRNPRKLFERECDKCQCSMITTYAPERSETVYCENCYNKEVLG